MSDWKNFGNYKPCVICGRLLALDHEQDYCTGCEEKALQRDMREYIRTHDVTEYKLAEIFKVPRSKVRNMVAEGQIEYTGRKVSLTDCCAHCGAAITIGTYCASCMRKMNQKKGKSIMYTSQGNTKYGRRRG